MAKQFRVIVGCILGWSASAIITVLATSPFLVHALGQGDVPVVNCNRAPAVRDCGTPPKPDGLYRLKSKAKLSDGRDLCINVDTGSGRYQQLDCRDVPSSKFFFSTGGRADHCYRIEQERSGGRETNDVVQGVGINQLDLACRVAALQIQWQLKPVPNVPGFFWIKNEVSGECIDADANHLEPAGIISPQACQALNNQYWTLF